MNNRLIASIVLAASLVVGTAHAAPVIWTFDGSVDSVDSMLTGTFHVGDPVSVKYTFDPSTPAAASAPGVAVYDYIHMDATFGSYTASYVPDATHDSAMIIINNGNTGLGAADGFGGNGFDQSGGAPVNGLLLQTAFVSLFDFSQTVFSNTSLPGSLNLADFQTKVAGLQFCTNFGCGVNANPNQVAATIRSLTVTGTTPEPPTWTLALIGLCAAAATRPRIRS